MQENYHTMRWPHNVQQVKDQKVNKAPHSCPTKFNETFHLLFADNTLIFSELNQDHLRSFRALLLCFETVLEDLDYVW